MNNNIIIFVPNKLKGILQKIETEKVCHLDNPKVAVKILFTLIIMRVMSIKVTMKVTVKVMSIIVVS